MSSVTHFSCRLESKVILIVMEKPVVRDLGEWEVATILVEEKVVSEKRKSVFTLSL